MKRSFFLLAICVFLLASDREVYTQSAAVAMRPAYTDITDQASRGAVLMKLAGYSSSDARYRIFNGTSQYSCWNPLTGTFVTSNSYSSGPAVAGDPTSESLFWVVWLRGSNNSTAATYRDRLGPDYSVNYQSASLPSSEPVTSPFSLTGKLKGSSVYTLDARYVILAWEGNTFQSVSHSDPVTGDFAVVCQSGVAIDRLEVRALNNEVCAGISGSWTISSSVGEIVLSDVLEVRGKEVRDQKVLLYPVPAGEYLNISGFSGTEAMGLYNLAGVKIRDIAKEEVSEGMIHTGGLPSGVYFLRGSGRPDGKVYRFVKQ